MDYPKAFNLRPKDLVELLGKLDLYIKITCKIYCERIACIRIENNLASTQK